MKHFNPTELAEHIKSQPADTLLLDVREPWEYDICHIENSTSIPMSTIQTAINELNESQKTVVICHHGIRSRQVAMFLEHNGFTDVINLTGGIDAWAQEVDKNMDKY